MNDEKRLQVLEKLSYFFNKPHTIKIKGGYITYKVVSFNPTIMYYQGTPRETLRAAVTIIDGYLPFHMENSVPVPFKKLLDILDWPTHFDSNHPGMYHMFYIIQDNIKLKTSHFNFPHVHLDTITLDKPAIFSNYENLTQRETDGSTQKS